MSLVDSRQAKRTFQGLMPEFYDAVTYTYPTATTVEMVYSHKDSTGSNIVTAIIQITYTDSTKVLLSTIKRIV